VDELGVRRQSEAATALSGGRETSGMRKVSGRAKAGSRYACPRSPRPAGALAGRSVAVLGRSNVQTAMRIRQADEGLFCHVAAPGDGRTPGGFWRDAGNGNRDGRAPQQCPCRAANGSLGWTNGATWSLDS